MLIHKSRHIFIKCLLVYMRKKCASTRFWAFECIIENYNRVETHTLCNCNQLKANLPRASLWRYITARDCVYSPLLEPYVIIESSLKSSRANYSSDRNRMKVERFIRSVCFNRQIWILSHPIVLTSQNEIIFKLYLARQCSFSL